MFHIFRIFNKRRLLGKHILSTFFNRADSETVVSYDFVSALLTANSER